MSRFTHTFEAFRLTRRDTKEAIYIRHPTDALRCLFIPNDAITHMSKTNQPGIWSIEVYESLAIEKGLI